MNLVKMDRSKVLNINRITVEFKLTMVNLKGGYQEHINRITVEFKLLPREDYEKVLKYINRITVEFKSSHRCVRFRHGKILIESQWNLN